MNFGFRLLRRFTGGNFSNVCNRCASTSSSVVFGAKKEFASKRADLPHEDEKLTGRGDFVGVKRKQAPEVKGVVPEAQIAKLQELACQNHRISAHSFFIYILHPLEQAQTVFCDIVRRSPQLYVSMFIKMCGEVMSDVPIQNRMIILNRLMKALYANGIKMTVNDMKAMLHVLLENCFDFNVKDMINVADYFASSCLFSSREPFVDAGVEYFMRRTMFEEAFIFWRIQCRTHYSKFGLQPLLDYIISKCEEHDGICKDRIEMLLKESKQLLEPSEFLACVVVSMLSNGYVNDAKNFAKLFTISGNRFMYPLRKLEERNDIHLVEQFAGLIEEVYFGENNTDAKRQKPFEKRVANDERAVSDYVSGPISCQPTVSSLCRFHFLLDIWKQPFRRAQKKFMQKPAKLKRHKVDVCQLDNLVRQLSWIWINAAEQLTEDPTEVLLRFHQFSARNGLRLDDAMAIRCKRIFLRNSKAAICPF